jgi:hypothetical protein
MLYTGASLIRNNGELQERIEKVRSSSAVRPVTGSEDKPSENLDEETRGALLRFARFIHKERKDGEAEEQKPAHPEPQSEDSTKTNHPYVRAFAAVQKSSDRGQILNIYA